MKIEKLLKIVLVGVLALCLFSCQSTRRTLNFETSMALAVDIESDVNPDSDGRASPVVLRVFMLADDRQFSREEFLNLYENAESRLGKDLIDTVTLKEFAPGEQRVEQLELTPEVKFVGLLAEFVRYQEAEALMLLPITDHKENEYAITLEGTRMAFTGALNRHKRVVSRSARESDNKTDSSITISSAEYERLKKLQKAGKGL